MAALRSRNGIWYIDYRDSSGKRVVQSTGTKDVDIARKMLAVVEGKLASARLMTRIEPKLSLGLDHQQHTQTNNNDWVPNRWSRMNPRERQAVIFTLFAGKCSYCGREVHIPSKRDKFSAPDRAVLDHRIPVAGGGSEHFNNVVLSCNACNIEKQEQEPLQFKIKKMFKDVKIDVPK